MYKFDCIMISASETFAATAEQQIPNIIKQKSRRRI